MLTDPWAQAESILYPPDHPFLNDPAGWVAATTGEHLWSKQVEIMDAVRHHRRVAVKACHGPGKSFIGGRIVTYWLDVHPALEAFAVTTAPTDNQVKAILWREITRAHRKGNLPGRITLDAQWKIQDELVAMGRKPADHDEHGFQGIHARWVLVLLDEACGIAKTIWTATDTLVTNEEGRVLAFGNPDDPTSQFKVICDGAPEDGSSGMSKEGWWVITISVFDTPNFTGEHVPAELRHYLPSATWVEERRRAWGEGSPLWTAKVLGEFPEDAGDGVVPWSAIKRCQGDAQEAKIGPLRVPVRLGVDVGAGVDETVIRAMAGRRVLGGDDVGVWRLSTTDSEVIVDKVLDAVRLTSATSVNVDVIGVGFGVVGSLRRRLPAEVPWPVVVEGVNVAEAAQDPTRFINLRAEIWWTVGREWCQDRAWDLSEVDDETLNELAAPKYREVNGRIQIESKDDVRKRLHRSTDNADSLLLAAYQPPTTGVKEEPWKDKRLSGRR